jgi:hypothetical protein
MSTIYSIVCDECGAQTGLMALDVAEARKQANLLGWMIVRAFGQPAHDYCRECWRIKRPVAPLREIARLP